MRDRTAAFTCAWIFVMTVLVMGGSQLLLVPTPSSGAIAVRSVVALCFGVISGVVAVVLLRWSWRRSGGLAVVQERSRAVRDGALPAHADESWLPGLRARRRSAQQERWLFPVLIAGTVVLAIAYSGAATPWAPAYWLALGALTLVLTVRRVVRGPRDVRVLDRLIRRLEQQQDPPA